MTFYRWRLLRAGAFRLDGGSMFGLIPRAVWSRACPADDRGRIPVQHNCLLLERASDPPPPAPGAPITPSPRLILIEAGTGDKLDAKNRDIFALEDRSILTALHEADCSPDNIDLAIVSHLHFDHAGGLTRACRPRESPDWTGPGSAFAGSGGTRPVKRSFPNARIVAQRREWDDALANRSVMTRTYFPDHLEPIREQMLLVDSLAPFPPGSIVERDASPPIPQPFRETEVAPGIFVFRVPGHTWGQQAIRFTDTTGRSIVFTPDVLPTAWHLGQAYSLAYDVEPYTSMVSRGWFLAEAADRNWTLCLDHEPGNPIRTVRRADRWFELHESAATP